jgi:hypothetical protein
VTDITDSIFISSDTDVTNYRIISNELLEGLEFEHFSAPPHISGRQITTENLVPMIKARPSVKSDNLFSQISFDAVQILVSLAEFLVGITEDIFHVRDLVPHVKSESGAVLTS